LQAYLDKMSELLIDKRIHREYRRYADTRVAARARTLAVLSQLDGKGKSTVLLFLREARLINKQQYVREGQVIYPRIVGLRGADLSKARLRSAQLVSTDRKESVSLEETILRGADLRGADLRGAIPSEVDWGVSMEIRERANLRGADLRRAKGLTPEQIAEATGDRTTQLPDYLQPPEAWGERSDERLTEE
jgi:hypothetical protein